MSDNVVDINESRKRMLLQKKKLTPEERSEFKFSESAHARHPEYDDVQLGKLLAESKGEDYFYMEDSRTWISWQGTHWKERGIVDVEAGCQNFLLELLEKHKTQECHEVGEEELLRSKCVAIVRSKMNIHSIENICKIAKLQTGMTINADALNKNANLLPVKNGTIDLLLGEIREHRREDMYTSVGDIEFVPGAMCPNWEKFIAYCFEDNVEMIEFIRRLCGYCITCDTHDQHWYFLFGDGGRGKSTFMAVLSRLLGKKHSYSAPIGFIEQKNNDDHPTTLASIYGKRLVYTPETRKGKVMDMGLVKHLTGEDEVSARFMAQDFFNFTPICKLIVVGNHKPVIPDEDEGAWRRVTLIEFNRPVPPEERDPDLKEKLMDELPGILNWCLVGARQWFQGGLRRPQIIQDAAKSYREEQDTFGAFCAEKLVFEPRSKIKSSTFREMYEIWCKENGCSALGRKELSSRMARRGAESKFLHFGKDDKAQGWYNVRKKTINEHIVFSETDEDINF